MTARRHRGTGRAHRRNRLTLANRWLAGAVLVGLTGMAAGAAEEVAPQVDGPLAATSLPTERGDDPGARGGRYLRAAAPTIVPTDAPVWDEGKGPVIVDGQPLPAATAAASPVVTTFPVATAEPVAADPPVGLPPIVPPVEVGEQPPPTGTSEPSPEPPDATPAEPTDPIPPVDVPPVTPTDLVTPPVDPPVGVIDPESTP